MLLGDSFQRLEYVSELQPPRSGGPLDRREVHVTEANVPQS